MAADTGDGIARLPFVITVFGALIVGLGTGSGLHVRHARRNAPAWRPESQLDDGPLRRAVD